MNVMHDKELDDVERFHQKALIEWKEHHQRESMAKYEQLVAHTQERLLCTSQIWAARFQRQQLEYEALAGSQNKLSKELDRERNAHEQNLDRERASRAREIKELRESHTRQLGGEAKALSEKDELAKDLKRERDWHSCELKTERYLHSAELERMGKEHARQLQEAREGREEEIKDLVAQKEAAVRELGNLFVERNALSHELQSIIILQKDAMAWEMDRIDAEFEVAQQRAETEFQELDEKECSTPTESTSKHDGPQPDDHCPHGDTLTLTCSLTKTCCACADKRPHSDAYWVYIDGMGYYPSGTRWQHYCYSCKSFFDSLPGGRAMAFICIIVQMQNALCPGTKGELLQCLARARKLAWEYRIDAEISKTMPQNYEGLEVIKTMMTPSLYMLPKALTPWVK